MEALGIDTSAQLTQLRAHPVYAAGLRVVNALIGSSVRSVTALHHKYIPLWLATISPAQVSDETRPKLIRYQEELVDILARLFYGEVAGPPVPSDPAVADLERRMYAAIDEMRLARDALVR